MTRYNQGFVTSGIMDARSSRSSEFKQEDAESNVTGHNGLFTQIIKLADTLCLNRILVQSCKSHYLLFFHKLLHPYTEAISFNSFITTISGHHIHTIKGCFDTAPSVTFSLYSISFDYLIEVSVQQQNKTNRIQTFSWT